MDLFILGVINTVLSLGVLVAMITKVDILDRDLNEYLKRILKNTCLHEDVITLNFEPSGYCLHCTKCEKTIKYLSGEEYRYFNVKKQLEGTGYKPVKIKKEQS